MYMATRKKYKRKFRNNSRNKSRKKIKIKNINKLKLKNLGKKYSKTKKFNRIQYGCKMKGGGPEFNPLSDLGQKLEFLGSSSSNTINGYTNNDSFAGVTNYP